MDVADMLMILLDNNLCHVHVYIHLLQLVLPLLIIRNHQQMVLLFHIRTYSPLIPVTDEEKDFLEETAQLMMKYPTIPCNDCKYCMPCPYALDIPGILLHYNKCVNEGNVPKSAQDENYAKARRAFLVGYDRSVPKLRQANHCTGCEQCNPHCPQGIDIPKEMQRIDKFVEELKVNG